MRRPRILVADDHPQVREALRKLLEPEFEVVGCVSDGRALVRAAVELRADLVLLDVGLPVLNGLDAGRKLKKLIPEVRLVYVSMDADPDVVNEAFRIGASAYVLKSSMGEELLQAIQKAAGMDSQGN